jgi:putative flippase GtrA
MMQMVRFAIVGGLATGLFLLCQYLFIGVLHLPTVVGTALSFAIGLPASYLGHHTLTFRRSGAHLHYGPRFLVVTAIMLLLSNGLAFVLIEMAGFNYLAASAGIGIVYPLGSFFLQRLWVFATRPDHSGPDQGTAIT